jgi:putative transferase (TIGR04331 family)
MKRFLVTTADERTWPTDQPVLFLGEWCRLYDRKAVWGRFDAEVVPYHWDDREKLYQDYQFLLELYEDLLQELARALNEIHEVDHSLRYWRIIAGPWLGYFVQILFDRWTMIERALQQYELIGVKLLQTTQEKVVPNDMEDFSILMVGDLWNEAIYGQLLRAFTTVAVEDGRDDLGGCHGGPSSSGITIPKALPFRSQVRRGLARVASWASQALVRENEAFFIASYLPIRRDLHLQWQLGQIPKIWRPIEVPQVAPDSTRRQWYVGATTGQGFEHIARWMIPKHMPTLYLEGYGRLHEKMRDLPWPKTPRLIFTSSSWNADDVFKVWAAEKVEAGVPFVIGQHGGIFGTALFGFQEDHQVEISDVWLSWGWDNPDNIKIKPCGNLKTIKCAQGWDPNGQALLVGLTRVRYSYHMCSAPVASQWLDYFEDQCRFTVRLPENIRRQLLVRLYYEDYGCCQKQRWQDRFPDVRLDDGTAPISSLIKRSRLHISTSNTTTFLESLSLNVPTIMFWNPCHWELRDAAAPYFDCLREAGIFHETPESAAAKVAEIWDDVPGWWNQPEIQEARMYFCRRFSRTAENTLDILKNALVAVA